MRTHTGKRDTLEAILKDIWIMLEKGAHHPEDAFHSPVLGTTAKEGCNLRTVILRKVNIPERILVCFSDARSAKIKELKVRPRAYWLFYHPEAKIQLRVSGQATLHSQDAYADGLWADTSRASRLNYGTSQPPGTAIDKPSSGLPDLLLKKIPPLLETEKYRRNFTALATRIDRIDWLRLKTTGHRRARFEWENDQFRATWLVP